MGEEQEAEGWWGGVELCILLYTILLQSNREQLRVAKTKSDHALAIFKSGVAAIPIVGGSIASLIGDYIPESTLRSVEHTQELLKQRLVDLEDRIDPELVNKEEFAELFKSCYLTIVRTHQESKRRGAASLLSNILLKEGDAEKLSYTELDHFARCLDALSIGAIEVLGHVVALAKSDREYGIGLVRKNFAGIHQRVTNIAPDLLMGLLGELNSFNLVHLTGSPSMRSENYANYPIELTPLGVRFAEQILQLDTQS